MPKTYIAGSQMPTWKGLKFSYSPRHGVVAEFRYEGAIPGSSTLANFLIANRVPFNFEQTGGSATIGLDGNTLVEEGAVEVPIDNWELPGNELINDWKMHPNSLLLQTLAPPQVVTVTPGGTLKTPITIDVLTAIQADVTSVLAGGTVTSNLPGGFQIPAGQATTLANQIAQLLSNGQDHYQNSQVVLKHVQTVSDNYGGSAGFIFSNLNKIYSTNLLLFECGEFPYPLPALYKAHIASLPVPAAQTGYTVGWLKKNPTAATKARAKSEIVTEYWYDQWPNYYYGQAQ